VIRRPRINNYQKILLIVLLSVGGFVLNRHLVDLAARKPPAPSVSPEAQTQQFIKRGYKPGPCNIIQPGHHHCNLDVPVDNQGNAMSGRTFSEASQRRHTSSAVTVAGPTGGYSPQQLHMAYQLNCTPGGTVKAQCSQPTTFGPQTIAIVDPGGYRGPGTLEDSLAAYNQQFGLPACTIANGCLKIVNQTGQAAPLPHPVASFNWDNEFDIDVQTAHMICQTCKIIVVESTDDGESLNQAVPTAASFKPTVISLSWGGVTQPADNAYFQYKGIAVVGASGDGGSEEDFDYPGSIAEVINVAGTTLSLNADNSWKSETVWASSGGGCAQTSFNAPTWQTSLSNWKTAGCGQNKADADVSAFANPNPGVAIYSDGAWTYGGGTSLAAPIIAGAIALAGALPATQYGSQFAYQNATSSNTHDITQGFNCTAVTSTHCTAGPGFDEPSGLGSFIGLGLFGGTAVTPTPTPTSTPTPSPTPTSTSTPTPTPAPKVGDINADGAVNVFDLSLLLSAWATPNTTADLNHDGLVNIFDISTLLSHWGT
jgi:hypothetical protein